MSIPLSLWERARVRGSTLSLTLPLEGEGKDQRFLREAQI